MSKSSVTTLLTRLLAVVGRSFPQYLRYSRPHVPSGSDDLMETLFSIAEDQDVLTERIGQMLIDARAPLRTGEFPMDYTDAHDLNVDFLVRLAVDYQRQDIDTIAEIAEQLQEAPAAKALAEEALGLAKGHLDSLLELEGSEANLQTG